jgi:hypothetical protein
MINAPESRIRANADEEEGEGRRTVKLGIFLLSRNRDKSEEE